MCRACKAKDQTIVALADQVDWLRMQLGTPWTDKKPRSMPTSYELPSILADSSYMSEEEADIEHMVDHKLISPEAAKAALEQIGALSTDIDIH